MSRPATLALFAFALALSACTQRTLVITTEPPGALVWLNDVEVGTTPVETDFTYYGGYDVRIRRPGYEPVQTKRVIQAPWYELPVVDLAAEMWPVGQDGERGLHNRVEWTFTLTRALERGPDPAAAEQEIIGRAGELRSRLKGPDWAPPNPEMPVGGDRPADPQRPETKP
ncbi:MAG: PEGA domain-containing protein [Phycisphaerales bacterium]|nr:PEGA domain-containing protein [Phycisphaerales bacterium]